MMKDKYNEGVRKAFDKFKVANLMAGAAAYNPAVNPGATGPMATAGAMSTTMPKTPMAPAAPVATGAGRSGVLG